MITPEVYTTIRRAVEIGKWPDGAALHSRQRELCMQAVIAYEQKHLPEQQRSGYITTAKHASAAPERIKIPD